MSEVQPVSTTTITGGDVVAVTLTVLGLLALGVVAIILFVVVTAPGLAGFSQLTPGVLLFAAAVTGVAMLGGVHLALVRRRDLTWADVGFTRVPVPWIAASVAIGVLVVLAVSLLQRTFALTPDASPLRALAPESLDVLTLLGALVLLGLITPLAEEVYYRGILYRWMRTRWRVPLAALASAVIFALTHPQAELPFMVLLAVLGILLALAYERTGSLWPPIAIHATNNCVGLVVSYALS
jgi:membrane protease YdiL (CAAX protease family)